MMPAKNQNLKNMMNIHPLAQGRTSACILLLSLLGLAACSEHDDDPKYRSLPPEFSGVTITALDGGELKAGKKLVVTAVQQKPGRLIYKAKYEWSGSDESMTHAARKEVVYDKENTNPTDTIVVSTPGSYKITLNARYYTSGGYEHINKTTEWEGGKAVYATPSFQYYTVQVEQRFQVK